MRRRVIGAVFILSLATFVGAGGESKLKRPRLDLRATPRIAFSPAMVLLSADLVGGDDGEEYYCPSLEWEWGDGGRSAHEADCPPYQTGTPLERHFSAEHGFRFAGDYNVKVTMRRSGRVLAVATAHIALRPGFGDLRSGED